MTILVTAATGKVGREVIVQLQARDVELRAGSRRGSPPLDWHLDYMDTFSGLFATIATGHAAPVLQDTAEVLGRAPRSLADFLSEVR